MKSLLRDLIQLMSLRERSLLLSFLTVGIVVWVLELGEAYGKEFKEISTNADIVGNFKQTLEQAESAEIILEQARSGLDGSKTFSAPQLVGRVDSVARETSLSNFDISSPATNSTELFSFHSVRLNIKRAQLEDLIRFDQAIKENSPYIALTQFQITANNRDPRLLDATFELVSFELKEDVM